MTPTMMKSTPTTWGIHMIEASLIVAHKPTVIEICYVICYATASSSKAIDSKLLQLLPPLCTVTVTFGHVLRFDSI